VGGALHFVPSSRVQFNAGQISFFPVYLNLMVFFFFLFLQPDAVVADHLLPLVESPSLFTTLCPGGAGYELMTLKSANGD
jgi:hypothetical protein